MFKFKICNSKGNTNSYLVHFIEIFVSLTINKNINIHFEMKKICFVTPPDMHLRHPFSLVILWSWFYLTPQLRVTLWTAPPVMTEGHLLLSGGRPLCCCFVWVQMKSAAGDGWAPVTESNGFTSVSWKDANILFVLLNYDRSIKSKVLNQTRFSLVICRFSWLSSWAERFSFLKLIRNQMICLYPERTLHSSG